MNDISMLLAIGAGATFVCLFMVKHSAVKKFLVFLLIMLIIGIAVGLLSK